MFRWAAARWWSWTLAGRGCRSPRPRWRCRSTWARRATSSATRGATRPEAGRPSGPPWERAWNVEERKSVNFISFLMSGAQKSWSIWAHCAKSSLVWISGETFVSAFASMHIKHEKAGSARPKRVGKSCSLFLITALITYAASVICLLRSRPSSSSSDFSVPRSSALGSGDTQSRFDSRPLSHTREMLGADGESWITAQFDYATQAMRHPFCARSFKPLPLIANCDCSGDKRSM